MPANDRRDLLAFSPANLRRRPSPPRPPRPRAGASSTRPPAARPLPVGAVRIHVPGFAEGQGDVPLIVRQLLADDPAARARLCADDVPRLSPQLITAAVRRTYTTHTRELSELLLRALAASPGPTLEAPPPPTTSPPPSPEDDDDDDDPTPTRAQIVAALERCDGVKDRAWRELGLTSRYQLKRLLKRHNIA